MNTCINCEKELGHRQKKTCSRACWAAFRVRAEPRTCLVCEEIYYRKVGKESHETFQNRKYCSHRCAQQGHKKNIPVQTCTHCGKDFHRYNRPRDANKAKTYCNAECQRAEGRARKERRKVVCEVCGESFQGDYNRKYCSRACYYKAPKGWHRNGAICESVYEVVDALMEFV